MKINWCIFNLLIIITFFSSASRAIDFPTEYHGVWDYSLEQCNKNLSTARVTITTKGIEYWESFGTISEVLSKTDNSINVVLSMSGEEELWTVKSTFRLNGNNLEDIFIDEGTSFTRVRCINKT